MLDMIETEMNSFKTMNGENIKITIGKRTIEKLLEINIKEDIDNGQPVGKIFNTAVFVGNFDYGYLISNIEKKSISMYIICMYI